MSIAYQSTSHDSNKAFGSVMGKPEVRPARVFMVEDSPHMQSALQDLFTVIGGIEIVAISRTEMDATNWLQQHPTGWDIATIDLLLEGGTGFNMVRRCRAERNAGTIVVLSDFVSPAVEARCREIGADAVYKKTESTAFADFMTRAASKYQAGKS
jgi:DNA-binding NarL/FixJ family response regulator